MLSNGSSPNIEFIKTFNFNHLFAQCKSQGFYQKGNNCILYWQCIQRPARRFLYPFLEFNSYSNQRFGFFQFQHEWSHFISSFSTPSIPFCSLYHVSEHLSYWIIRLWAHWYENHVILLTALTISFECRYGLSARKHHLNFQLFEKVYILNRKTITAND